MGLLTNIQRFSLNDGPGIRSTVFFKGCNIHCAWCHNPETISPHPQLLRYTEKCMGCGACIEVCNCFSMEQDTIIFDETNCDVCGECVDVCYTGALEICGEEYSIQEILQEVLQDKPYYDKSGGGVTLSGGEVLLQADFALDLLTALKKENVETAIETNFNFPFETILQLVPHVDLWMIDIKLMDPELHKKWTGADNTRILENIKKLDTMGIPYILRTPVIPRVNDTAEQIEEIVGFIKNLKNIQYYELLNFNPLGASKYETLSIENVFVGARPLDTERIEAFGHIAREQLKSVRIG